ncbi:unnamed protein product [Paramecium sonneborni]|uniref:Uncharacterized protein n=1 Tax=Paramecium sonneborni TaxID=65129 RepID=A0A8S1RT78_9CILI|nr:unnamed protein product [Paramecium sonneborni]
MGNAYLRCKTKCGDGILSGFEECYIKQEQDNGDISFNKCFNCEYQCVQNCFYCDKGICKQCQSGYILNDFNECINECGNQSIQEFELCDDGNFIGLDGCVQNQYDCQSQCQVCVNGYCLLCEEGFQIDYKSFQIQKQQNLKNLMMVMIYLLMDDMIINIHVQKIVIFVYKMFIKVVHKDKFINFLNVFLIVQIYRQNTIWIIVILMNVKECERECIRCIKGNCYQCLNGWYWNQVEVICGSKCGDHIIVELEECDNYQQRDDLYCNNKFQFECPQNCDSCEFGYCQQCQNDYYLIQNYVKIIVVVIKLWKQQNNVMIIIQMNLMVVFNVVYVVINNVLYVLMVDVRDAQMGMQNKMKIVHQFVEMDMQALMKIVMMRIVINSNMKNVYIICVTFCGDGVIVGNEKCDSGNIFEENGCYGCQYSCQQYCKTCQYGQMYLMTIIHIILK